MFYSCPIGKCAYKRSAPRNTPRLISQETWPQTLSTPREAPQLGNTPRLVSQESWPGVLSTPRETNNQPWVVSTPQVVNEVVWDDVMDWTAT